MAKTSRHGGASNALVTHPKGKLAERPDDAEQGEQIGGFLPPQGDEVDLETASGDGDAGGDVPGGDDVYDGLTVDELRAELKDRGLPTSGNKPDLIARLLEDDAASEG